MERRILFLAIAGALAWGPASGDEGHRHSLDAVYREECGGCHVPYPPRLLPARSWQAIMAGLDHHFGSDASLEPAKAKEIGDYLAAESGRPGPVEGKASAPRITETAWFRREHRAGHDGITADLWKSAAVKSPANCGACHPKAAEGDYGEGQIRLPRGR